MQQNKDNVENLIDVETDQSQLSEASDQQKKAANNQKKQNAEMKQQISRRLSYIRNFLKIPINPNIGAQAITNYLKKQQQNPNSGQYEVLRKLPKVHRDAFTTVNSIVPVPAIIRASDTQMRRIVRDAAIRNPLREESEFLSEEFQPPAMLVLKRQAIRQFPDGQRVVLYSDNKYGLTFTVPYDARGRGFTSINIPGAPSRGIPATMMTEETSMLTLSTGEEIPVHDEVVDLLEQVYASLNEENQSRMVDMLLTDKESFDRVIEFASNLNEGAIDQLALKLANKSAVAAATQNRLPATITKTPEYQRSIAKDAANKSEALKSAAKAAAATATAAGSAYEISNRMKKKK